MNYPDIIKFDDVSFAYSSSVGRVEVLSDLNLSIREGEFFGIVGPSGAGKTTLLRLTAGLLGDNGSDHLSGVIRVDGNSPLVTRRRRKISFLFQDSILFPWLTVAENAALPLSLAKGPSRENLDLAISLLERVGLSGFAHSRTWELSGGMQQRVALVRALITSPSVVLLDEPLASLDEIVRQELLDLIQELWEMNKPTVVFVAHDLSDTVSICDRIAIFSPRPGSIVDVVDINLPRPRNASTRYSETYHLALNAVRTRLFESSTSNT